jgi:hypothetical protein
LRHRANVGRLHLFACGHALLVSLQRASWRFRRCRLSQRHGRTGHGHTWWGPLHAHLFLFSTVWVPSRASNQRHACMYVYDTSKAIINSFAYCLLLKYLSDVMFTSCLSNNDSLYLNFHARMHHHYATCLVATRSFACSPAMHGCSSS